MLGKDAILRETRPCPQVCETRARVMRAAHSQAQGGRRLAEIDEEIHALCEAAHRIRRELRPMKTEDRRVCPGCGNEFSGAVEFCPVCMFRGALDDGANRRVFCGTTLRQNSRVQRNGSSTMSCVRRGWETGRAGSRRDGRYLQGVRRRSAMPVTLKVISERIFGDESARLRFLREARAAASVRHPNVASVFHLGENRRGLLLRDGVCGGRNARGSHQTLGPA